MDRFLIFAENRGHFCTSPHLNNTEGYASEKEALTAAFKAGLTHAIVVKSVNLAAFAKKNMTQDKDVKTV